MTSREAPPEPAKKENARDGPTAAKAGEGHGAAADGAADTLAPEPATATHAAEDEVWETAGTDQAHLEARIAAIEKELADAKDKFLRARADYDNLQRRSAQERQEQARFAAARIVGSLLEPLEVLEQAAKEAAGSKDAHAQGLRLAHRALLDALRREGLEPVPGEGASFELKWHEAVAREASDEPEGTVIGVVRTGYTLHGKTLRHAMVKVSAGPQG